MRRLWLRRSGSQPLHPPALLLGPSAGAAAAPAGKDIEKVACGSFHTLLLRRDGVVYGCGLTKHGQLPGATHRMTPEKVAPLPTRVGLRQGRGRGRAGLGCDALPALPGCRKAMPKQRQSASSCPRCRRC
jgi:hypothetical protein